MHVTVAICTWNRAELLDQTLRAFADLVLPQGVTWELLVVDNNCTDHTSQVIARHQENLPLRGLVECEPGQCAARNRAIAESAGELLVWTDDDVLIEPLWLSHYVAAAHAWPEATFFGGPVEPHYEVPAPRWVADNLWLLAGALAVVDLGDEVRPLAQHELPFGANMAIRRAALEHDRFDQRLGLKGNDHVRGDETDLLSRLRHDGQLGVWVGPARVRHHIPAERLTRHFVWQYNVGYGRTMVRRGDRPAGRQWRGAPRWLHRVVWQKRFVAGWRYALGRTDWVLPYIEAARAAGTIAELHDHQGHLPERRMPAVERGAPGAPSPCR